jgi:Cu(I)/Ag(I) efflux system membrane fusion protein
MKTIKLLAALGIMSIVLISGCSSKEDPVPPTPAPETTTVTDGTAETVWTCSMHPEVKLSKPGLCPKCKMKLVEAGK